ncbi:MAG TPA: glycosyltransferase [Acidimicrobiales bacterium]|nr:glycosyltransferase [Acidimicrobiales bacterium]
MLVERLAGQTLAPHRFEVVVVDNGSRDGTWEVLQRLVSGSTLRIAARRLPTNRGPAAARNAAVASSRAPLLAFTDDDCLPEPGWLEALVSSADGADIVQGRTEPDRTQPRAGVWDRTIRIDAPTALFETCNIAYRRSAFDGAGGFDESSTISARPGGRAFGEDALLGAAVVAGGGRRAFAPDAVVRHRYLPGTFGDHVREMRNLAGFPALVRASPALAAACWHRAFLTRRTASFDAGVVGLLAAVARRRPGLALAAAPWVVQTLPLARERGGRPVPVRLAQLALADAVGAASLVEGSIRHRRLLL